MSILGIDPASRTGWAYRVSGREWRCGVVSPRDLRGMVRVFREAREAGVSEAVMEDCFLGINLNTLKMLANIQGRVQGALEACGIRVRLVQPRTWKSAMLRVGGFAVAGRDQQKLRSMVVARRVGANPVTDDEADAVCLAVWGEASGVQEPLVLTRKVAGYLGRKNQRGDAKGAKGAERRGA